MSDQKSKIEVASYKGKRLPPAFKILLALFLGRWPSEPCWAWCLAALTTVSTAVPG